MSHTKRKHEVSRGALRARRLVLCLVALSMVVCLAGCRDSDALKEIIHDQTAPTVDYNDTHKFYINDSTSDVDSDKVASSEVCDEEPTSDIIQNLVVYSSTPNQDLYTAKKSIFAVNPDFKGIEASETVYFYKSDDPNAFQHAVTGNDQPEEEPEDSEEPEEQPEVSNDANSTGATTSGVTGTGTTGTGTGNNSGNSGTPTATPTRGGGSSGGQETIDDPSDPNPGGWTDAGGGSSLEGLTPKIDLHDRSDIEALDGPVVAFGQAAIAVYMIAGPGALVATDEATYAKMQSAGLTMDGIVKCWKTGESKVNVQNIISSGAKYVIIDGTQSQDSITGNVPTLDESDLATLQTNNIGKIVLRSWYSSTVIKENINAIGNMFQGSSWTDANGQTKSPTYASSADDRAEYYCEFHDEVVSCNDGLARQTSADQAATDVAYQSDGGRGSDSDGVSWSGNTPTYTVLVNEYDSTATYGSDYPFSSGVAFSKAGWATTPVSYYMQAGGTLNNTAIRLSSLSTGEVPVLQTQNLQLDVTMSLTCRADIALASLSNRLSHELLDSGVDLNALNLGAGLGTATMPKLVATSQAVADGILANSESGDGLYSAYGWTTASIASSWGNQGFWTTIGSNGGSDGHSYADGTPNPTYASGAIDADDIVVNPRTTLCDWTLGTVESFFEAGFIYDEVNGGNYDWETKVAEFYNYFYGVSPQITRPTE